MNWHMSLRATVAIAAIVGLATASAACGSSDSDEHSVRVMAAASLVDVMKPMTQAYGDEHGGAEVQVDAAASSALVQRLESGAKADVLITADTTTMDKAVAAGVAKDPVIIATNKLVIVVPAGNPSNVTGLEYFTAAGHRTVICASEVPCGRAAETAISAINGTPQPISRAVDVRAALGAVTSGEADAALVYATDATSAGDKVETIEIPNAPVVEYPAAALTDNGKDFVNLLSSDKGKQILTDAGFGAP
ncbi:MAG: molybdate ABC transporter substrate-binding protein [Gordonia sp. (in: high G+C Gram-positive bacteria)]|uniref:molybdate ABC transporter substrate-binding protein n=1 Tax=Gordonia sp. (in: high G+C Gram-positive bacteria) TaxID=84139 RepID=UPI003BB4CCB1